jgi:hypothetical protein
MKQTAVEWFSEQLLNLDIEFDNVLISRSNYWIKRNSIVEQAKEMEKQQIVNAVDGFPLQNRNLDGEQYYNETFKNK